jgi:hypothetical protein
MEARQHRKPLSTRNFKSVFPLQLNLLYFIQELHVLTSSFKVGLSTTENISWQMTKLLSPVY